MIPLTLLARFRAMHRYLLDLVGNLSEEEYRTQYHPDLSPAGWHLGHCLWVENHWLRAIVQGDDSRTRKDTQYYQPQFSPKSERGPKLPPRDTQLSEVASGFEENILLLADQDGKLDPTHPLMQNEYLPFFLLQHHSQHLETLRMVLTQRAQQRHRHTFHPQNRLTASPIAREMCVLEAGRYSLGGEAPGAFDNELPADLIALDSVAIATRPVSNAEYLGFMEDNGYGNIDLWDEAGREWLKHNPVEAPDHWRLDDRGWWYGIGLDGPQELEPRAAVYGISWYEARAFANWAKADLPHELSWEAAARYGHLALAGQAWEWCANTFYPYSGFKAFPYREYSSPWFDGRHYTLRGASRFTPKHTQRPSFRNFHTADKRHIFAGLRLAF